MCDVDYSGRPGGVKRSRMRFGIQIYSICVYNENGSAPLSLSSNVFPYRCRIDEWSFLSEAPSFIHDRS